MYSCLILSDPVCSLLLHFLSEIRISLWWNNYITYIILSIPVCSCLILSVTRYLNLFLLLKFLHEIWIYIWKKCRKYIKNKERKKEKDERWKRGMEKIMVDTWPTPLFLFHFAFMSPLFLLYAFIFSLDLLYFRSRSCNGFTPLCFVLSHNFQMKILKTSSLWYLEFMIQIKSGLWSFMHIGVVIVNDFHRFGNSWQKNLTVSEIHFSNMIIKEARACLMTLTLFLLAMGWINLYTANTWHKPVEIGLTLINPG